MAPATDYTDLWWNPNESGWGLNIVQHASRNIFAVWFTYARRRHAHLVRAAGRHVDLERHLLGTMYATTGPARRRRRSIRVEREARARSAPPRSLSSDASHGTCAYTVDGVSGTKAITRQPY